MEASCGPSQASILLGAISGKLCLSQAFAIVLVCVGGLRFVYHLCANFSPFFSSRVKTISVSPTDLKQLHKKVLPHVGNINGSC